MRSLHLFLKEKRRKRGLKVSRYGFSDDGTVVAIPFYAVERLFSSPMTHDPMQPHAEILAR